MAIWEMPARQDYDTRAVSYDSISASVVVVDLTNPKSFVTARRWRADVLVANQKGAEAGTRAAAVQRPSMVVHGTTVDQNFLTWATESRRLINKSNKVVCSSF